MKYILVCFIFLFVGCVNQSNLNNNDVVVYKDNKPIIKLDKNDNFEIDENIDTKNQTIAMVYASNEIGKYAIEATNSALTYLLNSNKDFQIKVYDIKSESVNNIQNILSELETKNIDKVILMITAKYINNLFEYKDIDKFHIYLPLVNNTYKKNLPNIYYGGISYVKQFNYIEKDIENNSNIIEIYDDKSFGNMLHRKMDNSLLQGKIMKSIKIKGKNIVYSRIMERLKNIDNLNIILNTSIIKSSIFLSQLRANDIEVKKIYSTQVNYSPLLLVLTQLEDRKNLIVLNSIPTLSKNIYALNEIMGNDILYNWVNCSVIIGVSYFINDYHLSWDLKFIDNQIDYKIKSYDLSGYGFKTL